MTADGGAHMLLHSGFIQSLRVIHTQHICAHLQVENTDFSRLKTSILTSVSRTMQNKQLRVRTHHNINAFHRMWA